jgi:hypothetical protein
VRHTEFISYDLLVIYAYKSYEDDEMPLKKLSSSNETHEALVAHLNSVSWWTEACRQSTQPDYGFEPLRTEFSVRLQANTTVTFLQSVHGREYEVGNLTDRK